jgi:tRNA threonylcarbamoyladenosine biosynthesis protein TsaE
VTRAEFTCDSVAATARVAAALAALARAGQVVVLAGGLGAGKTTFTKAYAAALGVTTTVTSPSYTLVHHYKCGPAAPVSVLLHADLWRLDGVGEVADLALDELLSEDAAAVVEWGDRFESALPGRHVVVEFRVLDETTRALVVDVSAAGLPADALDGVFL